MAKGPELIWIVDDDTEVRSLLMDFVVSLGWHCETFDNGLSALERLSQAQLPHPDVIISDIKMPQMTGIELCERVKELYPHVPVVLATAYATVETAIEGMKKGAFDYVMKPFKLGELEMTLLRAIRMNRLEKENELLRKEVSSQGQLANMLGRSPSMIAVFDLISRVAKSSANVIISGESGTGKELVARAIHKLGVRSTKPFIAINCSAIPENLLESELFGHAKGSFTGAINRKRGLFEEADGGTLFLDEIGDLSVSLQAKLLRVLQEHQVRAVGENISKEIDVRVIAASHKDLRALIREGKFREDLYYRLCVIPISIPPLRQRKEDIPILAQHFLKKYAILNHSPVKGFTTLAMDRLVNLKWEGNVRELENLIERLVVLTEKSLIDVKDIPVGEESVFESFLGNSVEDLPKLDQLEKRYMKMVLEKVGGRKEKAAQILGINRRTLYRKERDYGFVMDSKIESELTDSP